MKTTELRFHWHAVSGDAFWEGALTNEQKAKLSREVTDLIVKEMKQRQHYIWVPIGSVLVKDGKIIGRGRNKRVQKNDPIMRAEIDCLRNAGRIGRYSETILYSTLMPCYLCASAIVQFVIKKVVVGESETFAGAREFMESHGVEAIVLNLDECKQLMNDFIRSNPQLQKEDIGELRVQFRHQED